MGRRYTGADYTTSAYQLDAGHLRRSGIVVPGKTIHATMSWPDGGPTVNIESTWTDQEQSLSVSFRLEEQSWTQRIAFRTEKSNLGRGELLYLVCPRSGKGARKLYRAYHSQGFYHREAFSYRLYYPLQATSWMKLPDRRYAITERKLEKLQAMRRTSTYRGQLTKRAVRVAKLQEDLYQLEELRWSPEYLPKALLGLLSQLR
jgi:hypothetical protein